MVLAAVLAAVEHLLAELWLCTALVLALRHRPESCLGTFGLGGMTLAPRLTCPLRASMKSGVRSEELS
jgi:hypothetical protein